MPLNDRIIGKKYPPSKPFEVTDYEGMYYALAYNEDNDVYFDKRRREGTIIPPMYAVKYMLESASQVVLDQEIGINMDMMVLQEVLTRLYSVNLIVKVDKSIPILNKEFFNFLTDLIRQAICPCSCTSGILKCMNMTKSHFLHNFAGILKFLHCFTGKTHNYIRCEIKIRVANFNRIYNCHILLDAIKATHSH